MPWISWLTLQDLKQFLYFIILLAYIYCTVQFHCHIPGMFTVCLGWFHPLCHSPLSLFPSLKAILSFTVLFSYMCIKYVHLILPPSPSLFILSLLVFIPKQDLFFFPIFHFSRVYSLFKGFHPGISPMNTLFFKQINPSISLPYLSPEHIHQQFHCVSLAIFLHRWNSNILQKYIRKMYLKT
jgi:hypothetical protein